MAASKKIALIEKTYELLRELPPSEIKIRTVAEACGCSPAAVYKHFSDLDDLIRFASVRFLEEYITKIQDTLTESGDALEILLTTWREFAAIAFRNVDVYLELFWGRFKNQLGDTIFEYYEIFPDKWKNLGGLFTSTFFNNEIQERNYIIVRRAAVMGYFHYDEARLISDLQCYLMHGMLMDYRRSYRQPEKAEEGFSRFMELLESTCQHYRIR